MKLTIDHIFERFFLVCGPFFPLQNGLDHSVSGSKISLPESSDKFRYSWTMDLKWKEWKLAVIWVYFCLSFPFCHYSCPERRLTLYSWVWPWMYFKHFSSFARELSRLQTIGPILAFYQRTRMSQIYIQPGPLVLFVSGWFVEIRSRGTYHFQTLQGHNGPPRSQMETFVDFGILGNIL